VTCPARTGPAAVCIMAAGVRRDGLELTKRHRATLISGSRTNALRDCNVAGNASRISCALRRMLMRLMVPSRGQNAAGLRLVRLVVSAMCPVRLRLSTRETNSTGSLSRQKDTAGIDRCNSGRHYGGHAKKAQSLSCSPEHELFGRSSDGIITTRGHTAWDTPAVIAPGWPSNLARQGGRATDSLGPPGTRRTPSREVGRWAQGTV
jgi:hypothetical protein